MLEISEPSCPPAADPDAVRATCGKGLLTPCGSIRKWCGGSGSPSHGNQGTLGQKNIEESECGV